MKQFGVAIFVFLLSSFAAHAKCQVLTIYLPGGTFTVVITNIVSVSTHEYLVDGVARVTELNIDTIGNVVARIYHLEPLVPKSPIGLGQSVIDKVEEKTKEVGQRTGMDEVWKKVVKNYPVATHAHTVEYRVENKEDLAKLQLKIECVCGWRCTCPPIPAPCPASCDINLN